MKHRKWITLSAAVLWLGGLGSTDARSSQPARSSGSAAARQKPASARFIGDRRTRLYYPVGQGRNVPSARNRVQFRSEAQARAAGYRPWRVPPSLPPSQTQNRPPASPLSREQPNTTPTAPAPNQ
jgi:hypothetical protein